MTMTPLEQLLDLHDTLTLECRTIMENKNHDYTQEGDPYSNFRASEIAGVDPRLSILVRMVDKIQRLVTYVKKGELKVNDEGVEDSVKDIINYAILFAGLDMQLTGEAVEKEKELPIHIRDYPTPENEDDNLPF